jgi:hypothetical protein
MPTPKYKVRPDTGELQEYLFEYNGILALKNFVARVDGERLILHSAEDMNFSILDALVSEVEINGVVYDNADAAQQALQRLTFNTNRPVIMTQRERELLLGALQSSNYVGTAADLKSLIDGKVDKEAGKGLSTNDFTNAYKQKLDTLEDYDIELDENTTELRFKKGSNVVRRISLMFLDDEGTKLVYNKPEKTLELRDKRNNLLTSIPVSHFVSNIPDGIVVQNGKIKLMAGNNVIFENAFSYNDLADKPNLNFAPASHRHNWDDIDGKPEMVTEEKIKEVVGDVFKYRGTISLTELDNTSRQQGGYATLRTGGSGAYIMFYTAGSTSSIEIFKKDWFAATRLGVRNTVDSSRFNEDNGAFRDLAWYSDIYRAGIERYNWDATKDQQNSTVFVPASGFINLSQLDNMCSISFRKVFAGGQVTFTCDGKQIIYTGDNSFNGGDGSTAVVSIWNNKCYIDIRNI